ncbi:MAG: ABC transporter ATP-binding protein [Candidatus Atribacteria bacterium]|nr:ABC transporter ATP-binding protein [Candidatus Atribacteria bacterium]
MSISNQETLALIGETGCGKSIVAQSILRLLPTNAQINGRILFQGRDLLLVDEKTMASIRGKEIAIIFQNPSLALNPVYTIGWQVGEPFRIHQGAKRSQSIQESVRLLSYMKFDKPESAVKMYPFEFSGGMNQRALIASALALHPNLIIADEPTRGLDRKVIQQIIEQLDRARKIHSSSMLIITHDLSVARSISDWIMVMYAGEIVERAPTRDFFQSPFHPYAQGLLGSLPENGFHPISGQSPSMIENLQGCQFHPRCKWAKERCLSEKPELLSVNRRLIRCFLYD